MVRGPGDRRRSGCSPCPRDPQNEAVTGLSAAEIERLASLMQPRTFGSGELVQRQGVPLEGLLLVTAGRLSMYAGTDEANRRRVATIEAGMLLGELSVSGGTAVTDVVADTDTEAILLPTQAFHPSPGDRSANCCCADDQPADDRGAASGPTPGPAREPRRLTRQDLALERAHRIPLLLYRVIPSADVQHAVHDQLTQLVNRPLGRLGERALDR